MGNENQRKMLPTLQGVIESSLGVRLPSLPSPPRTLTNLDKVCAALLDVPPAHVERSGAIFEGSPQSDNLSAAFVEAMGRHLRDASNEKISAAAEGLVTDYLEKRSRRARVLEIAAREITQVPPILDANALIDDDWMAFFKGKVDHLGTEEAKLFFGKVLAGEIKQPGAFSKRSVGILAEMGPRVGRLFDSLCNISTVISRQHVRVLTLGLGDVGENSLEEFGLPFEALNHLIEAGLIFSEYDTFVGMSFAALGQAFEIGGTLYRLHVSDAKTMELDTTEKRAAALVAVPGVTLSAAGRELRAIVSKRTAGAYVEKLGKGFADKGFDLWKA